MRLRATGSARRRNQRLAEAPAAISGARFRLGLDACGAAPGVPLKRSGERRQTKQSGPLRLRDVRAETLDQLEEVRTLDLLRAQCRLRKLSGVFGSGARLPPRCVRLLLRRKPVREAPATTGLHKRACRWECRCPAGEDGGALRSSAVLLALLIATIPHFSRKAWRPPSPDRLCC